MADPPLAFFLPCAFCTMEVVASVPMLRKTQGFKCPECGRWTDLEAKVLHALEQDYDKAIVELRRRFDKR